MNTEHVFYLTRRKSTKDSTIGDIYYDGKFLCYTLEDGYRESKEHGKTRIPPGKYKIVFRKEGNKVDQYRKRFGLDHNMLWLKDVPGFEYVYIHIGNTVEDTLGCILVGSDYYMSGKNYALIKSLAAYLKVYNIISKLLKNNEDVYLVVKDDDHGNSS